MEAVVYFSDLERCREFAAMLRWPNGVTCPREGCGSTAVSFYATRGGLWRYKICKNQFTVKVGTIFEDSSAGLDKGLTALWLITTDKKGIISSYQVPKAIGVTQKTAWAHGSQAPAGDAYGVLQQAAYWRG